MFFHCFVNNVVHLLESETRETQIVETDGETEKHKDRAGDVDRNRKRRTGSL